MAFPTQSSTAKLSKQEQDYRAEDDHRTLTRAAEIGGDPDRMKGVAKHHRKTQRGLARVGRMIGGKR